MPVLQERNVSTAKSTQFASIFAAFLIAATINGGLLMTFDAAASPQAVAANCPVQVTLDTVTVVAHRS